MTNEIILYSTPEGDKKVGVLYHDENFWLTQKVLAGLFNVKVPAVSKHLKNIFDSGELEEDSVVSILETTAADGKNYKTKYYNLDAIIAVGYRVNSNSEIEESDEENPGIILDFHKIGNIVGIEILNTSKRMENPRAVEYAVAG